MTLNKEKRSTKDIVFKCTYNDGGVGKNGIGFTKTCSDALIKQHIKEKRRGAQMTDVHARII